MQGGTNIFFAFVIKWYPCWILITSSKSTVVTSVKSTSVVDKGYN